MNQVNVRDVEALRALVTPEFGPWGIEEEVTQERINHFADVTCDHQWIHVDVERAKAESPFGGTIAHGFLVMSLLPALMPPSGFELTGHIMAVNYGGGEYRFVSPVPAGSRVHARTRLAGVEDKGKGILLTQAVEVAVVGSEKPALAGSVKVLYVPGPA